MYLTYTISWLTPVVEMTIIHFDPSNEIWNKNDV